MRNLVVARDGPRRVRPRPLGRRGRGGAGGRGAGPALRRPRDAPSAPSPTSPRPYIQETIIEKRPRPRTWRSGRCPRIRPLLVNTAGLFHDLRPGFAALRPVSDDFARRDRDRRQGAAARRRRSTPSSIRPPQALLDFNNNAGVREGIDDLDELFGQAAARCSAFVGPAQSVCNYAHAAVPQRRQPPRLRRRHRHLPALHRRSPRRRARTTRAAPARRPANGGGRPGQLPARQPLPEHRLAGPGRASARRATRPTSPASR